MIIVMIYHNNGHNSEHISLKLQAAQRGKNMYTVAKSFEYESQWKRWLSELHF